MIAVQDLSKIHNNAFFLIEFIVVLSIISILISFSISFGIDLLKNIYCNMSAITCYQLINIARLKAIAFDSDTTIQIRDSVLITNSDQNNHHFPLSSSIRHTISNKGKLGFKTSGNTKYAGTITLKNHFCTRKVSLGVGYGKITLK